MSKHSRTPSLKSESRSRSPDSEDSVTVTASPDRSKILRESEPVPVSSDIMHCSLPPHRETLSFASYEDYEVHYHQAHVNRCSQCSKNFPTGHYLELHIEENHDPLAVARRDRGEKTYGCFVEKCEKKCSTPQKRRRHLIDKHMFPRSYNFFIINDGIDRHTSMLRPMNGNRRRLSSTNAGRLRRRSSTAQSNAPVSTSQAPADSSGNQKKTSDTMDIDDITNSTAALQFVPASVTRNRIKADKKPNS